MGYTATETTEWVSGSERDAAKDWGAEAREPWPEDSEAQWAQQRAEYEREIDERQVKLAQIVLDDPGMAEAARVSIEAGWCHTASVSASAIEAVCVGVVAKGPGAELNEGERFVLDAIKWQRDFKAKHGEPWSEDFARRWDAEMEREAARAEAEWRRLTPAERAERDKDRERKQAEARAIMKGDWPNIFYEPSDSIVAAGQPLSVLNSEQCAAQPGRKSVIKGLLSEGDLGCVFGPPGSGKSILVPHIGYRIAQGRPAFGRRCKQGRVLYVPAEDQHGMRQRARGLKVVNGKAPGFLLVEGVNNLRDTDQVNELWRLIVKFRPRMVVIDTIALAFPGIDENASKDMGEVVRIGRLLARKGAAVVLIHHDTKSGSGTPRGHSILNGALDVSVHLTRDDAQKVIRGKLVKNRNGSCDLTLAFHIMPICVGTDEDGDAITAPTAVEITGDAARKGPKLSPVNAAALRILRELIADGKDGVAESVWRDACEDQRLSTAEDAVARARTFRRAFKELFAEKLVSASGGYVSLAVVATRDFPPAAG